MSAAAEPVAEAQAEDNRTRKVPAVRRATAMLWHLGRFPDGLPLSRIARDLDVLPSTALHILRELVAARLVAHDANTKLYRLGSGVLTLARQLTHRDPFVQAAQPVLRRLSNAFHVGASVQERDGDEMVVVAAASVLPGDMVSPGGRTPLFTSASGRLMAAFNGFSEADLRRGFARVRWQEPPDQEAWLQEVRAVRRAGHATDDGRFRRGITAIAAPVFSADGSVRRAISITTITAQLDARGRRQLTRAVLDAAAEIAQALR
jgi:DNA-binding IclR family transcriptional regulator